jgi:hypothetical protein
MTIGGVPEQQLCAAHADGFWLSIIESGSHPPIDVASLFKHHMRLLGTNPANWTSHPPQLSNGAGVHRTVTVLG